MSQLTLHRPVDLPPEPKFLSFQEAREALAARRSERALDRARHEYRNRTCPRCRRVTVEACELDDHVLNRNGAIIPLTATVVGFRCSTCSHEWQV